jgi:predicted esterase
MIEIIPDIVDTAFLYFHTRRSSGDEIAPFVEEIRKALPTTYVWAGDGCIEGGADDPIMRRAVSYGTSRQRYWFVFPMQSGTTEDFVAATEAMGAVLATSGGYVNALVEQVRARFQLPASRVVLCGHQHGACVALAAAMMRRTDPFALTVLFDPWPLETLYLQFEQQLPETKVICVDNLWVRERERQRGAATELYKVFRSYGMNAEGITLTDGHDKPDEYMFREAMCQIKLFLR